MENKIIQITRELLYNLIMDHDKIHTISAYKL